MSLGEHCDEIVRLIDETLEDCLRSTPAPSDATTPPPSAGAGEAPVARRVRRVAAPERRGLTRSA